MNHRERLIALGLLQVMPEALICERNNILFRIQQGEVEPNPPLFCVYRKDEPSRCVVSKRPNQCKDAELIADKLKSYEAQLLASNLNRRDPDQPGRERPNDLPGKMYAVCKMSDWADWETNRNQMVLKEVVACG